jgi:hypothetical protein
MYCDICGIVKTKSNFPRKVDVPINTAILIIISVRKAEISFPEGSADND